MTFGAYSAGLTPVLSARSLFFLFVQVLFRVIGLCSSLVIFYGIITNKVGPTTLMVEAMPNDSSDPFPPLLLPPSPLAITNSPPSLTNGNIGIGLHRPYLSLISLNSISGWIFAIPIITLCFFDYTSGTGNSWLPVHVVSLTGELNRVEFLGLVEKGLRDSLREKERGEKREWEIGEARVSYRWVGVGFFCFVFQFLGGRRCSLRVFFYSPKRRLVNRR